MASTNMTNSIPAGATTPPSVVHIHLDNSLGAAFIGLILAAILFGVTNVQSLIYFQSSARDPTHMKWTIAFLWSLDALHLALISHVMYFYMVTNFTNLAAITETTWSLCLHVLITTMSDFIVRLYYARRVWIMSRRNWFLTLGSLTFTSITFVSGMGFGIKIFSYSSTSEFTKLSWVLYLSLGSGVAADTWVAGTLCYFLGKNRTGFKATDTKVNMLMLYIINTGLLTSVCAICSFVSFAIMPHNYIFIGFYFSLSKLYFNSLLATLNARDRLREGPSRTSKFPPGIGVGYPGSRQAYQMAVPSPRGMGTGSETGMGTAGTETALSTTVMNSKMETSFGSVGDEFGVGRKEDTFSEGDGHRAIAVTIRTETETDYHTSERKGEKERYTSVLPL